MSHFLLIRSLRAGTSALLTSIVLALASPAQAADRTLALVELSLEELAKLPVISVSRRPAPVATAAASIYVITGEDIRRSGATTLPEALRLAPNLQVARQDASNYAISARGFNNILTNKLLVLIDGRTVYSPLFSGVFWDSQTVVLEDIERIEVISGPGATLWGANAVNGVINITTRPASDTQGTLLTAGGSMLERHVVARHGITLGDGHFRTYAKHSRIEDMQNPLGLDTDSGLHRTQAGFRGDWQKAASHLTLQGDAYSGRVEQNIYDDRSITGANVLGRVRYQLEDASEVRAQLYLDHAQRDQPQGYKDTLNSLDLDLQHSVQLGRRHSLVWGGGYHHAHDNYTNTGGRYGFVPGHKPMNWANVFAQNDIALFRAVQLTLGMKLERNPYTGWESLPNVRLSWAPRQHNFLLWSALSRSVRSPSRIDRELNGPLIRTGNEDILVGGPDFESEIAHVLELGYRAQPAQDLSYSLTLFYSEYDDLRTFERAGNIISAQNRASAETYGVEYWAGWQITPHWRMGGGLVAQEVNVNIAPGSTDVSSSSSLANADPEIYWQLRSSWAISDDLEAEAFLRHVGELGSHTTSHPSYESLDIRLGWQLTPNLELSFVGQNLLNEQHRELGPSHDSGQIRRALYSKILWEF